MKCNVASINHKGVRVEFVGCFCVGCYGEGERDLEDKDKIQADLYRIELDSKLRHKKSAVSNSGLRIRKVK
jgi:hypothetical protein